jgi:hypothetical protein
MLYFSTCPLHVVETFFVVCVIFVYNYNNLIQGCHSSFIVKDNALFQHLSFTRSRDNFVETFFDKLLLLLDIILKESKFCVICGDMNINTLEESKHCNMLNAGTYTGIRIPVLNTANTGKHQSGIQYRYSVPGKKQSGTQYRYPVPEKVRAVLNTGIQYRKKSERY